MSRGELSDSEVNTAYQKNFKEGSKRGKRKGDGPVKSISGHEVIKALTKIGFEFVKQRGSHIKLKKTTNNGKRIVIVPLHKDLPDRMPQYFTTGRTHI